MTRHYLRSKTLSILLILYCSISRGPAFGEQIMLTAGHVLSPASLYALSVREFRRRLITKLGTSIEVSEKGGGELGNEGQLLHKVMDGEPILGIVSPVMTEVDDQFGIFDMPYLILTREHLKSRRAELMREFLEPAAARKGVRVLGLWENGFRHVTNNVHPVEKPGDFADIKLRVPTGRWQSVVFKTFGAAPVPMQFDKVPGALRLGEIDGQENPLAVVSAQKLYEVQKYLSLTSHTYLPAYFIISEKYFQSLPPAVQTAIALTAKEMEDWVLTAGEKLDIEFAAELSRKMTVNEADKLAFIISCLPIYIQFTKTVPRGKELINLMYDKSSIIAQR